MQKIHCAIYTRKSSEEGLEQEFNSLHAQREACASYIASQKAEGWVLLPEAYDDGGISGGTLDRPALQRLLADIDAGLVDQIVVYKIDRLTRSLADFAKMVDRLDAAGTSFVSVTQSFNTATSMGRLTLNMLLSFAQFEREVTAERIRDKIAASKRKGLWMGGCVPLGYDQNGRTLSINDVEAKTVRTLYDLYRQYGTVRQVKEEADRLGLRTKVRISPAGKQTGGQPFLRGHIWQLLTNPIYAGRIRHRRDVHEGQHPPIIPPEEWGALQARIRGAATTPRRGRTGRIVAPSPLTGKLFDETGDRLTPSHSKTAGGKRLRYYISHRLAARSGEAGVTGWRLPAAELEAAVADLIRQHLREPGFVLRAAPETEAEISQDLRARTDQFAGAPDIVPILGLPARIDLEPGRISITLDAEALGIALNTSTADMGREALSISAPFQSRKRGVETRIVLSGSARPVDRVLLTNIANAHAWFGMIRAGRTYDEIAAATGTSRRRVQQMLGLAFLAPDVVRAVTEGRQPVGLTSDWLKSHPLPAGWPEQRALIATL